MPAMKDAVAGINYSYGKNVQILVSITDVSHVKGHGRKI